MASATTCRAITMPVPTHHAGCTRPVSAAGQVLAVEAHVDRDLAEPGDLERDRKILPHGLPRGGPREAHQHRVRRLLLRLLLGQPRVLPGQAVLRIAADPDPFAQVLRAGL